MQINGETIVGPWDTTPDTKTSHQTAIRLEPELYDLLKDVLDQEDVTMNRLIRMLLWKHIDDYTK